MLKKSDENLKSKILNIKKYDKAKRNDAQFCAKRVCHL